MTNSFDFDRTPVFIGDIHGQARTLLALLERLGWKRVDGRLRSFNGEALVFVGDLIDRGPRNLQVVETVRTLVEHGDALCLMGNHEFNAVHFHTPDPDRAGEYLRKHSDKNVHQHQQVLAEVGNRPATLEDMLGWFRQLPVAVEGPGWRCVHACWHAPDLSALQQSGNAWYVPKNRWVAAARPGRIEHSATERLLKGPEFELPGGACFFDKDGNRRHQARIRWWHPAPETLDEALLFQSRPSGLDLDTPYVNLEHPGYHFNEPPVFFGHYWKSGVLTLERPNVACIDYSAGKGDRLVAYRLEGGVPLQPGGFVVQPVIDESTVLA